MSFGKSSAFFWCSLLLFSLPSYSFPKKRTPLLTWWLHREAFWGAEWDNTTVPLLLAFSELLHRTVVEKEPILQNRWKRTNSAQPVTADSKLEFTRSPAVTYFFFILSFPKHAWNFFPPPQHKPDVLFRLVCPLYQRTNSPIWSL